MTAQSPMWTVLPVSVVMVGVGACGAAGLLPSPRLALLVSSAAGLAWYCLRTLAGASARVGAILDEELTRRDED
ncbi:hypothetical protein FPZ12_016050 [Amycolatopsis acidicola]|uniref:Uncharacterized protein n=1 Tax=Amycolatopsis acidicola TaxID=2596893 RepID=A0A5N0V3E5_9PSEU|nr:hypothetical protein [Amycolatopsis acidicola]KAA9160916.1 hypothetical protein FPZ12_016050 [Amycolatopsis acidicola]